jgi:hypothetical protein
MLAKANSESGLREQGRMRMALYIQAIPSGYDLFLQHHVRGVNLGRFPQQL